MVGDVIAPPFETALLNEVSRDRANRGSAPEGEDVVDPATGGIVARGRPRAGPFLGSIESEVLPVLELTEDRVFIGP
jgi:hypothetical protein